MRIDTLPEGMLPKRKVVLTQDFMIMWEEVV